MITTIEKTKIILRIKKKKNKHITKAAVSRWLFCTVKTVSIKSVHAVTASL